LERDSNVEQNKKLLDINRNSSSSLGVKPARWPRGVTRTVLVSRDSPEVNASFLALIPKEKREHCDAPACALTLVSHPGDAACARGSRSQTRGRSNCRRPLFFERVSNCCWASERKRNSLTMCMFVTSATSSHVIGS